MELPFNQTFVSGDLAVIGLLVILEGVLSIDNALVLGLLAKRLPKSQQGRALTYGLIGAFVFRFIAIATAQLLLRWTIVKLIGGAYLLYVAAKYFFFEGREEEHNIAAGPEGEPILVDEQGQPLTTEQDEAGLTARAPTPLPTLEESTSVGSENPVSPPLAPASALGLSATATGRRKRFAGFWSTVVVIELTDIAFAIDSILAAIALVGGEPAEVGQFHPKLWVVVAGGMLGVILMRFAAVVFIKLLERFPRFEISAYLLVSVIGAKLTVDWAAHLNDAWRKLVDFHTPSSVAFWVFWIAMLVCLGVGFIPKRRAIRVG